jgi:hypothetical protein
MTLSGTWAYKFIMKNEHLSSINSRSIREVERMLEKYTKYPKDYRTKWINEFVKK